MDLKEAVAAAKIYVGELFAEDGATDIILEEVDFDKRKSEWLVTVSFRRRPTEEEMSSALGRALASSGPRHRKVVRIDRDTGVVRSVTGFGLSLA